MKNHTTPVLKNTIVLLFICFTFSAKAVLITGRVTDEKGAPMAFANVYIKGTTNGTTTNADGNFKLDVQAGTAEVVFSFIGYKMTVKPVSVGATPLTMDAVLATENYSIKEVVIVAGEDPAFAIIRKAISKRKYYLEQVNEYACDVYIKGVQRLTKYPKKFLGKETHLEQMVDSASGIIYLSESVSKFNYKKQGQVREEMISSKVSGSSKAFSYNQASDMLFNFYENLLQTGVSPRGAVSPISANALFYYNYRLEGSFIENNMLVHKITVLPKRKNDPVFRGTLFIQDSTWRIHSADLVLTKDAQILFVDSLTIKQVFLPVTNDNSIWLPATNQYYFHFGLLGFEGNGSYIGILSHYNLQPGFAGGFFGGEIMKVNADANKKDSAYWSSTRPVPLAEEEEKDYVKKDSLQVIHESKPYLDSLDRVNNKLTVGSILISGYDYHQRYKKQEFKFSPLIKNIQFNTVEGINFSITSEYIKRYEERKRKFVLKPFVKYGVANKTFSSTVRTEYFYNREHFSSIAIEGGKNAVQFNDQNPISPFLNTAYSLLGEKNYMKLFANTYGLINYVTEIINGIYLNSNVGYAERAALVNHNDYTFKNYAGREYTSNNPLNATDDEPAFATNQSLTAELNFRFRVKQKYISRPDEKIITESVYPTLILNYKKGVKTALGSDVDYDLIKAGVADEVNLGLLGTLNYELIYGKFLNNNSVYFMDYRHFNGNRTIFSTFNLKRFNLLDYYTYSTNTEFVEAHIEHDFSGFVFNKIPLLRKLKLDEIAGFHYLHIPHYDDHFEFSFGISKLNILRAEFVAGITKNSKTETGIRISLGL